ncbi:hypothetical protein AB4Z40_31395 [Bosea sp. 2YAB26]|uniref:hypothetical protein n=1 Tax=Bosea sp. 2YAB26 TaxID=3237478 RepID=UPI003F8DE8BA
MSLSIIGSRARIFLSRERSRWLRRQRRQRCVFLRHPIGLTLSSCTSTKITSLPSISLRSDVIFAEIAVYEPTIAMAVRVSSSGAFRYPHHAADDLASRRLWVQDPACGNGAYPPSGVDKVHAVIGHLNAI